jgi:uncharacterized protein (TIGR00290 family)
MKNKIPAIFSWSGGKDSSYALYKVLQENIYDVKYLLSTFNGSLKRLSMHGICETLIEKQAESIGIPLLKMYVYEANNAAYEKQMNLILTEAKAAGIETVIFGDIFLEDLRKYREEKMNAIDMQCAFPIWNINTNFLVNDFIGLGFKSCICCINDGYLTADWCGKTIDHSFVANLPTNVDACGENGEYHSFCYEGPIFKNPISISLGNKIYKPLEIKLVDHPTPIVDVGTKGFWFQEINNSN